MADDSASYFLQAEADLAVVEARKRKAEQTKDAGDPIEVKGKIIRMILRDDEVWTAESGGVARRVDLKTGKTVRLYRGHTAPVTSVAFFDNGLEEWKGKLLVTGSWDKTIRIWELDSGNLLSTTTAHTDFVKAILPIPQLRVLVSSSSDKTIKLWDTTNPTTNLPLLFSLSAHRRPVEALYFTRTLSPPQTLLYSGDTMGLIKVWEVEDRDPANTSVRATPKGELQPHRTGVTGIIVAGGYVWSSSLDSTLQIQPFTLPPTTTPSISLPHPKLLRALLLLHPASPYLLTAAGDVVRVYSLPDPDPDTGDLAVKADEVELMGEVDAHYHDVTAICVWSRVREDGQEKEEWIVSGSLDGTIRKWKLSDLLKGKMVIAPPSKIKPKEGCGPIMTEEEERELEELMGDDE